ncbi:hypothetical protein K439DRAFT_1648845 [Ramaria rubella]|nr:hypothetical protein K439DRAFT_1648845 [Ramaria rubella]
MSIIHDLNVFDVKWHKDLYFKDGNIILIAEDTCFRVHSGQLTRHSDVFRGMMDIPQPLDAPLIDGCPVIKLHDKVQELIYMLNALYDGLYFCEGTAVDFTAISAILRLSTKYFFGELRRRALGRLRLDWPSTLAEWDRREKAATSSTGLYKPSLTRTNPILIINLARELCLPSLLPAAFYDLSRYISTHILSGSLETPDGPVVFLKGQDNIFVFMGKEAGQQFVSSLIAKELEDRKPAEWCRNVHNNNSDVCRDSFAIITYETLRAVGGLTSGRESDPLFLLQSILDMQSRETGRDVAEKPAARGCEMCRSDMRTTIQRARQTIWDSIPGWFGINHLTLGFEEM